jgi:cell division protein FtsW
MMRTGPFVIGALFFLTIVLVLLGVIVVFSASQYVFTKVALENINNSNVYNNMGKQLMGISLGLALLCFFYLCDFNIWERYSRWIMLLAIVLLALVFPPFGQKINGAYRWLGVGPFRFQPSEFAKIAVILYLSSAWAGRIDRVRSITKVFFPIMFVGMALGLILIEPNNSTTFLIGMIVLSIWFVAGGRLLHLAPVFVAFCCSILTALYYKPNLFLRIKGWLDPDKYPDTALQFITARNSFAHGGLWGVGLGEGQGQFHIPEAHTDYIFSIMGEELGFVLCALVICLYLALGLLGFWIAMRCSNPFGRLVAVGCTTVLILQATLNIAVVTGCLPTTGLALPFLSYGRSSLLVSMSLVGLLMNVAKESFDAESAPASPDKRRRAWASA